MIEHPTDELGLYALGLLDRDERSAIEGHLATCSACRSDLASHDATLAALGDGVATAPRRDLRDAIVGRHRRAPWLRGRLLIPYAASALLAVALIASVASLSQERAARDEYGRALAAVASGGRVVALQPREGTGARGALVISRDGGAYLVLELPPAPAGKGYEAWVIRDGTPRPAGMAPSPSGIVTMQIHEPLRAGDVAAITVEDARGVQHPTTDPLLIGQV